MAWCKLKPNLFRDGWRYECDVWVDERPGFTLYGRIKVEIVRRNRETKKIEFKNDLDGEDARRISALINRAEEWVAKQEEKAWKEKELKQVPREMVQLVGGLADRLKL